MTIDRRWYVVAAVVLSLSVAYFVGKRQGALDTQLGINHTQIRYADSVTKSVTSRVDTARKKDALLDSARNVVRQKVRVVHDTVIVHSRVNTDTVVNGGIAALIQADDSLIAAQKRSLALQDTLIASLRVGLNLRDERIDLLQKQHSPRLGIKSGIAIGAVSTVAAVVVAVKIIQAFHK